MAVELRCGSMRGRRYARGLRSDALALMRLLRLEAWELSVMIVGDNPIRSLNRRFRGKDRPTDVLSFSQLEERAGDGSVVRQGRTARAKIARTSELVLGDVAISIDTALRQARRLRVAPATRLRTLLIHGLLHLLGYDHERSAAEAKLMFARERQLAAQLSERATPAGRARQRGPTRARSAPRMPR